MNLVTAINVMKCNKELLGFPNGQGNTWSPNANTIACDFAIGVMEKELERDQEAEDEWNMRPRF